VPEAVNGTVLLILTTYKKPSCRYDSRQYCLTVTAPPGVKWHHRSLDYLIAHMPLPIGGPLERSL